MLSLTDTMSLSEDIESQEWSFALPSVPRSCQEAFRGASCFGRPCRSLSCCDSSLSDSPFRRRELLAQDLALNVVAHAQEDPSRPDDVGRTPAARSFNIGALLFGGFLFIIIV